MGLNVVNKKKRRKILQSDIRRPSIGQHSSLTAHAEQRCTSSEWRRIVLQINRPEVRNALDSFSANGHVDGVNAVNIWDAFRYYEQHVPECHFNLSTKRRLISSFFFAHILRSISTSIHTDRRKQFRSQIQNTWWFASAECHEYDLKMFDTDDRRKQLTLFRAERIPFSFESNQSSQPVGWMEKTSSVCSAP